MEELTPELLEEIEEEVERSKEEASKERKVTTDLVKAYLQEVSKHSLLSLEEEVDVTWRVWEGNKAKQKLSEQLNIPYGLLDLILKNKILGNTFYGYYVRKELKKWDGREVDRAKEKIKPKNLTREQKRLLNIALDGEQARQKLIMSNVRLVISVAKKYLGRGMSLIDLIQEGNLGLMRAIEKFDPRKKLKFSTYATWWIRQSVSRAIADQARTIRLPVHIVEVLNRASRLVTEFRREHKRNPNTQEIADMLGGEEEGWTKEKVEALLKLIPPPTSLEMPVTDGATNREVLVGDLIESDRVKNPEELVGEDETNRILYDALNSLSFQEKYTIMAMYGLLDDREHTLEEVGVYLGLTRERVRQLKNRALRKLKAINAELGGKLASLID